MSKWMGLRVSYPCANCGKQFTLNKKSRELPNGEVLCPECTSHITIGCPECSHCKTELAKELRKQGLSFNQIKDAMGFKYVNSVQHRLKAKSKPLPEEK